MANKRETKHKTMPPLFVCVYTNFVIVIMSTQLSYKSCAAKINSMQCQTGCPHGKHSLSNKVQHNPERDRCGVIITGWQHHSFQYGMWQMDVSSNVEQNRRYKTMMVLAWWDIPPQKLKIATFTATKMFYIALISEVYLYSGRLTTHWKSGI